MALTFFTFDGVSSTPYGYSPQLTHPGMIPHAVRFTLGGSLTVAYAASADETAVSWAGVLNKTMYDALRAKMKVKTSGTLTSTQGSCTATLVVCNGTPRTGLDGSDPLYAVALQWVQTTAWTP